MALRSRTIIHDSAGSNTMTRPRTCIMFTSTTYILLFKNQIILQIFQDLSLLFQPFLIPYSLFLKLIFWSTFIVVKMIHSWCWMILKKRWSTYAFLWRWNNSRWNGIIILIDNIQILVRITIAFFFSIPDSLISWLSQFPYGHVSSESLKIWDHVERNCNMGTDDLIFSYGTWHDVETCPLYLFESDKMNSGTIRRRQTDPP